MKRMKNDEIREYVQNHPHMKLRVVRGKYQYIEKNGKRPLGFNYDEWNSFAEYKEYLEKELEKQHLLESRCFYYGKKVENMWLLVLIISIKLQMPTWYWIIFTIITILRPLFIEPIKFEFYQGVMESKKNK